MVKDLTRERLVAGYKNRVTNFLKDVSTGIPFHLGKRLETYEFAFNCYR